MARKNKEGYIAEEAMELLADTKTDYSTDARRGVLGYCVWRMKHGPMMDIKIYPIWSTRGVKATAEKVRKESREAQKNLNLRRSMDNVVYLANENFGEDDVLLTLTSFNVPGETDEDRQKNAKKVMRAYIERLRRAWNSRGRELKYIYSMEYTDNAIYGRRYHTHILLNAHGFDRDWLESLWGLSACNTERYQHQDEFMSGFAGYLKKPKPGSDTKNEQKKVNKRAWSASKNLKRPQATRNVKKISIRKIERIARAMESDARQIIEKVYPGYRCTRDVVTLRSDMVPGVYAYARLRSEESMPWKTRNTQQKRRRKDAEDNGKGIPVDAGMA